MRELEDIAGHLVGRPRRSRTQADLSVSLHFPPPGAPLQLTAVRAVIPGLDPDAAVDGYRYATLAPTGPPGVVEPFLIALRRQGAGRPAAKRPAAERQVPERPVPEHHVVVAAMLLDADFLRHEQDFGLVSAAHLSALEEVVRRDLAQVELTRQSLPDA